VYPCPGSGSQGHSSQLHRDIEFGIYGGHSGTDTGFSPKKKFSFPSEVLTYQCSIFIIIILIGRTRGEKYAKIEGKPILFLK
jgi:hypothetical protein